jgi:nucleoside-diphosphate-sugar epimerase
MRPLTTGHLDGMTVAVTGATGNLGTALLRRLTAPSSGVAKVRGLSRREPPTVKPYDTVRWFRADLSTVESEETLAEFLDGADAVVHLAWAIQPGREPERLRKVNVEGTRRVAHAARAAGVGHVVHMSSLGAYAPAAVGQRVGEDWPATGIPTSQYSRDKAEAEHVVRENLGTAQGTLLSVVRPTLVLQPEAGSEIGRYFLGPLLFGLARMTPGLLAHYIPLPLPQVAVSFVHADDVADAVERILDRRAPGEFNLAAEPLLDASGIARALGVFRVPVPAIALRTALSAAFAAHLVPTEPGWLDIGVKAPALDTARARKLLDWAPFHRGDEVLEQFVAALGLGAGGASPLLRPAGGPRLDAGGDPANAPGPRAN